MPLNEIGTGCQTAISVGGFTTSWLHKKGIKCFMFSTVEVNVAAGMFCIQIQKKRGTSHRPFTGVHCTTV